MIDYKYLVHVRGDRKAAENTGPLKGERKYLDSQTPIGRRLNDCFVCQFTQVLEIHAHKTFESIRIEFTPDYTRFYVLSDRFTPPLPRTGEMENDSAVNPCARPKRDSAKQK